MTHQKPEHLLYGFWNASLQDLEPLLEAGPPFFFWSHPLAVGSSGTDGEWRTWASQAPLRSYPSAALHCFLTAGKADATQHTTFQAASTPLLHKSGTYPTDLCKQSGRLGGMSQLLFWVPGSQTTRWRPQPFQSEQHNTQSCQQGSAPAAASAAYSCFKCSRSTYNQC